MDNSIERILNTLEAGRVLRYHSAPTVQPQTDGLHSFGVAVLALYVTNGEASGALLRECIMHDTPELFTGDAPFPVKRDHQPIKDAYDELELAHRRMDLIPASGQQHVCTLDPHDAAVLKVCDTLEGLIWCRKTEQCFGAVRARWSHAYRRCQSKFAKCLSDAEWQNADQLFNYVLTALHTC